MDESLPPAWLDELRELLAIPSVSADPAHARDVARAAEWVAERVRALGGAAELREDGRLVVGEIAGPPAAPTLLVYGHYDVQPPAPLELWESDPFSAEVRGEWLYARGVADDKGQLWMQLKAIEELLAEGPPPVTFRIGCDGEEETGGDAILRFLESDHGPVDACVVLDGWMKTRNTPEFVVATRGLVGGRRRHSGAKRLRQPAGAREERGQRLRERVDRIERGASVVAGVQVALPRSHLDVERDEAAGRDDELGCVARLHPAVENDAGVDGPSSDSRKRRIASPPVSSSPSQTIRNVTGGGPSARSSSIAFNCIQSWPLSSATPRA